MTPDHLTPLERRLVESLRSLLFIHDNVDETGYVTDVGFYPVDQEVEKAREALAAAEQPRSVGEGAEDWAPNCGEYYDMSTDGKFWNRKYVATLTRQEYREMAQLRGLKYRPAQKEGGGE